MTDDERAIRFANKIVHLAQKHNIQPGTCLQSCILVAGSIIRENLDPSEWNNAADRMVDYMKEAVIGSSPRGSQADLEEGSSSSADETGALGEDGDDSRDGTEGEPTAS